MCIFYSALYAWQQKHQLAPLVCCVCSNPDRTFCGMALSPSTAPSLTSFRALAFDIFGTLVDEPKGLASALEPLTSQLPEGHEAKTSTTALSAALNKHEAIIERQHPRMLKEDTLFGAYNALAKEWGLDAHEQDAKALGEAYGKFPAFPDTVQALQKLGTHYKLIPISNCSEKQIEDIVTGALKGIHFAAVLTAEAIGSFKPSLNNFEYLLKELHKIGVKKEELLIVAQGVGSDHVPAKQMGINSAWISRGRPESEKGYEGIGEQNEGKVGFGWRWNSMGDMARDVELAFSS